MSSPAGRFETLRDLVHTFGERGEAQALLAFVGGLRESWSFRQLQGAIALFSAALLKHGLKRGDPVAILAPNGCRWIAAFLAAAEAGAAAMPIDERTDAGDVAIMLRSNGCRWLVTTERHRARLAEWVVDDLSIVTLDGEGASDSRVFSWNDFVAGAAAEAPVPFGPDDIAAILHTSGTTGTPKAVPLSHANLLSNIVGVTSERLIGRGDRVLLPLPLHHIYPLTIGLLTPLASGATIILPAGISGPEFADALRDGEVTHLVGVPRLYEALVAEIHARIGRAGWRARIFRWALGLSVRARTVFRLPLGRLIFHPLHRRLAPRLRELVCGGAALDAQVESELEGLGWEVLTGYGLTETSPILSFNRRRERHPGSVGRPLPGVELRIANPDSNGLGEIEARGASVFRGYRHNPDANAKAFTADGWFRTGDLGSIDANGLLHISARLTETIVLASGKKIFPEDVEAHYAGSPLIQEIALLSDRGTLVALVVPRMETIREHGAARAEDLLREEIATRGAALPAHERLSGFAVTNEPLPRTLLGKLRRHLLGAIYARAREHRLAPKGRELSAEDRALLAAPLASRMMQWLQERFPQQAISPDTSPQLDLGLDSLGWLNLTLDIQRTFGISLTEATIARVVTVRDLLQEASKAAQEPAVVEKTPEIRSRSVGSGAVFRLLAILDAAVMGWAFRLRVKGIGNLPLRGPCLICPNHASFLDPLALVAAMPYDRLRETWWAGWTGFLFTGRLRRAFSRIAQIIPIDPDRAVGSSLAWGRAVLGSGRPLVWFPEGARSYDGSLQRFLPGVGALLKQHPVPVVPLYIEGAFDAWPRTRRWPRRGHVSVTFGPAIDPSRLIAESGTGDPESIAAAIRMHVAELSAADRDRKVDPNQDPTASWGHHSPAGRNPSA